MKTDEPASSAPEWHRFRRVGTVVARRLDAPMDWVTRHGDTMHGGTGDWLVTDETGGARTVTDASFRRSHRFLVGDTWERVSMVNARPALVGERITTPEGDLTAHSDDWLIDDRDGVRWFVPGNHFAEAYRMIEEK